MRKIIIQSLVFIALALIIDSIYLKRSISRGERQYAFGVADRWLDKNVRGHKKPHWMPYFS